MGVEGGLWNYGESPEAYPIDTGRLANVLDARLGRRRLGPGSAATARAIGLAVHRSFVTYVAAAAHVKVVDGTVTRADHRHRHRLWLRRQPRAHPQPDRGRRGHGHDPRAALGDHFLRRRGRAEQLLGLRDGAVRQLPDGQRPSSWRIRSASTPPASASPACRRSPPRSSTASPPPPASGCATCRSARPSDPLGTRRTPAPRAVCHRARDRLHPAPTRIREAS